MKLIAFLTLHSHISISIQQKCRGSAVCCSLMIPPTLHTAPHFLCFSRGAQQQPGGGQLGPGYRPFYPISRVILSPSRTPRSQYLTANNVRHCISTAAHQYTSHRRFCSPGSPEQTFSKTNKEATISHLILGKFIHFLLHFMWKRAFSCFTLYWR